MRKLLIFRHLTLVVVAVSTLLALASCQKGDDNVQLFRDAALQLDNTRHTLTDEFDYWPDCGIRVTGSHLASLISLEGLQKLLPCPLFVSATTIPRPSNISRTWPKRWLPTRLS